MRPVQLHVIKLSDFLRRVALHFYDSIKYHVDASGVKQMLPLKGSMREVARHSFRPQDFYCAEKGSLGFDSEIH